MEFLKFRGIKTRIYMKISKSLEVVVATRSPTLVATFKGKKTNIDIKKVTFNKFFEI